MDSAPGGLKEQWSEGDYDYSVRIHGPKENAPEGSNSATKTVLRMSRRLKGFDSNGQGYGWEYADDNNNWYRKRI